MLRRLPIMLVPILVCTSCNTFFAKLSEPADDSGDTSASDTSTDLGQPGDTTQSDMLMPPGDMRVPPADLGPGFDMPDLEGTDPGAALESYRWAGTADAPLTLTQETCGATARRVYVETGARPTSTDMLQFAEEIEFVPLHPLGPPQARLGWIEAGSPLDAAVTIGPDRNVIEAEDVLTTPTDDPVLDMALGAGDLANNYVWATSVGVCATDGGALLTVHPGTQELTVFCSGAARITAVEAGNGYDPFFGELRNLGPTLVWQEPEGPNGSVLVASGDGFQGASAIIAPWPNAISNSRQNFSVPTHGDLAFFPDASGRLWAWNVTNSHVRATGGPEAAQTDLDVVKGGFDIVSLANERYVTAQVVGNDIELAAYDGANDGSSDITRVGRWFAVTDLSRPDALELATFAGGFVLWYQQRELDGPPDRQNGWWVHAFEVNGDHLTSLGCAFSYRYADLNNLDNDLAAWRDGEDLIVAGAVHYQLAGASTSAINVEGPVFDGIFAP